MMDDRISSVAPGVVERVRRMHEDELRDLARRSARWAADRTSLRDEVVIAALASLERGRPDAILRAAVGREVEVLDRAAWDLQDKAHAGRATEDDYVAAFAKARCAAAVHCALAADPFDAALGSMYEAQAMHGSVDELLAELGLS